MVRGEGCVSRVVSGGLCGEDRVGEGCVGEGHVGEDCTGRATYGKAVWEESRE